MYGSGQPYAACHTHPDGVPDLQLLLELEILAIATREWQVTKDKAQV